MKPGAIDEMRGLRRQQYIKLVEVSDLTKELLAAADRRDQTSIRMLINMRAAPLRDVAAIEERIDSRLLQFPEEDAIRLHELLKDPDVVPDEDERPLVEQSLQYRRLLERTAELDRRLSTAIGGKRSYYVKTRKGAQSSISD